MSGIVAWYLETHQFQYPIVMSLLETARGADETAALLPKSHGSDDVLAAKMRLVDKVSRVVIANIFIYLCFTHKLA